MLDSPAGDTNNSSSTRGWACPLSNPSPRRGTSLPSFPLPDPRGGAMNAPPPVHLPTKSSHSINPTGNVDSNIRIGCFNLRGFQCNQHYGYELIQDFDVIGFSEHWLHSYNLPQLRNFHNEFAFVAVAPPDVEDNVFCIPQYIRGHGGVAIGWRKSLSQHITTLSNFSNHRMTGIKLMTVQGPLFIISVYMPSRSGCTDPFKDSMDQLGATIELLPPGSNVIIMGDFNADPGIHGGPKSTTEANEQGRIFLQYLQSWDFTSTHLHLNPSLHSHT